MPNKKVLLIQPYYNTKYPPMGLGYISSYLKQYTNYIVQIFDQNLNGKSTINGYIKVVKEFQPDVIGISMMTLAYYEVKELMSELRKITNVPIIIGGPQVTTLKKQTLIDLKADFAVIGEGELTFKELLGELFNDRNFNKVKGIIYRDKDRNLIENVERELIKNLDSMPMVDWTEISSDKYNLKGNQGDLIAPILTSRGCPHNCYFCASAAIWKRKIRFRSAENVFEEIVYLVNKRGIKGIEIADDNFTTNLKRANRILDYIINNKLKLRIECATGVRADGLDLNFLQKFKKAGGHTIAIGIESGSQKILDNANKDLKLETVEKTVHLIKKVGLTVNGFFILGLPAEEIEDIKETIDFSCKLKLDRAWYNIFTPYPGSKYYYDWVNNYKIDLSKIDWKKFNSSTPLGVSKIPNKVLNNYKRIAFLKFYLRPRILLNYLRAYRIAGILTFIRRLSIFCKRL